MDDILDGDGLGLNTTFSNYIKGDYGGILSFLVMLSVNLTYMGLTIFLYFYSQQLSILIIMVCIITINTVQTIHKYLVWRYDKIEEYKST
jgi:membrane protein YdbS with pleckstrin-like domain